MREVKPQLHAALAAHTQGGDFRTAAPYPVSGYRELVEHVASLAYLNMDHLMFFRGQGQDYTTRFGASTYYPSIYRGVLSRQEIGYRFEVLQEASRQLTRLARERAIEGADDVRKKRYIQWSILQHYEVCDTPLLDLTHSIRVACSFADTAAREAGTPGGVVSVFALPFVTNRISINSEHDVANVRLLSICPPQALRPYFQDGYLAGTTDVEADYDDKSELDFVRRLVAKFQLPSHGFWNKGFGSLPRDALYPPGDVFNSLCTEIRLEAIRAVRSGDLGRFLLSWTELEERLTAEAKRRAGRSLSILQSIDLLAREEVIGGGLVHRLHSLRSLRNQVVHTPMTVEPEALMKGIDEVEYVSEDVAASLPPQ